MSVTVADGSALSQVMTYEYPPGSPASRVYEVKAQGEPVFVYHTHIADFAAFSCSGPIKVHVHCRPAVSTAAIRPLSRSITPVIDGAYVHFSLPGPMNVLVDIPGLPPLYIYANPLENSLPSPHDPRVRYFRAGKVHEVGELTLHSNEEVYLEGGAVVQGCIRARQGENVRIRGFGILDGSCFRKGGQHVRSIVLERCRQVRVENLILIEPCGWMVSLVGCQGAIVRNYKGLGEVLGSDGVDICSSRDVHVDGCCIFNNDDGVAVKAILDQDAPPDYPTDVDNVLVENCIFRTLRNGCPMEIGHELRTEVVQNVVFRNNDVLSVHGNGQPISINNYERAIVRDILFENIRIEHYYDKLLSFRINKSRYSKNECRGQIRNVMLRNIDVKVSIYNPGYSVSLIGGYDVEHTIENVTFENFLMNGVKATCPEDLDLYLRHAKNVTFR